MLDNIAQEVKDLWIGPTPITINKIQLNEENPFNENTQTGDKEARIDVYYDLHRNGEKVIDNQFFSFYIGSSIWESKTGKTQYLTDSAQFIWAEDEAKAKAGFEWSNGSTSFWITNPSEKVYPAFKKLEPFIAFLAATIGFDPRKGAKCDFVDMINIDQLFSDHKLVNSKLAELSESMQTTGRNKVRVMFLVDDKDRNRIDTKNKQSFGFASSTNLNSLKKAIEKKADTEYPYISGIYSMTFQKFNPAKLDVYAGEIARLSGVAATDDFNEDDDQWDV